jgi:hypothetical protein
MHEYVAGIREFVYYSWTVFFHTVLISAVVTGKIDVRERDHPRIGPRIHEYESGIRVHLRLRAVQVFVRNSWRVFQSPNYQGIASSGSFDFAAFRSGSPPRNDI